MQDYFLESLKLQRIDFFVKLVAASKCDDEEKQLLVTGWAVFTTTVSGLRLASQYRFG